MPTTDFAMAKAKVSFARVYLQKTWMERRVCQKKVAVLLTQWVIRHPWVNEDLQPIPIRITKKCAMNGVDMLEMQWNMMSICLWYSWACVMLTHLTKCFWLLINVSWLSLLANSLLKEYTLGLWLNCTIINCYSRYGILVVNLFIIRWACLWTFTSPRYKPL